MANARKKKAKKKLLKQASKGNTTDARLPPDAVLKKLLAIFLQEDLGAAGDVTSNAMISAQRQATAFVVARKSGVLAGTRLVQLLAGQVKPALAVHCNSHDGEQVCEGQKVFRISGSLRGILLVERTMLNLLGRLSGVATFTNSFAKQVVGTKARIRDTRKTTPGLRALEKYAVICGGGVSHRAGLFDAFLAKDNHVAGLHPRSMALEIQRAIGAARRTNKLKFAMVEVDTLDQLEALLRLPHGVIDAILLDNMDVATLRKAVALRDLLAPGVQLEASGGVTLATIAAIAKTGVDFVSVGAITHSAAQIDFAMDIQSSPRKGGRL
ncbi:MAG: carboxylating nicotinate-nucleotide diphosphorylase [Phycisphaerales bacterium]|nr:carboxylating nicotinate-nucleotide diphosphorylase [Phycisphaerales bacterium]